jgi:hypothetical protein
MAWTARASVAILLVLASATVPLLRDRCTVSCEHARAAASPSEPTCHHTSVPMPRVGHQPTRCGHDHEATVTTLGDPAVPTLRAVTSVVTLTPAQIAHVPAVMSTVTAPVSPPRDPLSRQLSVSLRI